jgi:hypothetical protein
MKSVWEFELPQAAGLWDIRAAEQEFPSSKPQTNPIKSMKKLLTVAVAVMMAGASYAGCGVKIPVTGQAKSYDAEKKQLTVGDQAITLDASAKITNAKGEEVKIADLVGKKVTVSTDKHNKKGESVAEEKL